MSWQANRHAFKYFTALQSDSLKIWETFHLIYCVLLKAWPPHGCNIFVKSTIYTSAKTGGWILPSLAEFHKMLCWMAQSTRLARDPRLELPKWYLKAMNLPQVGQTFLKLCIIFLKPQGGLLRVALVHLKLQSSIHKNLCNGPNYSK